MSRRYDDPVEVRRRDDEPAEFLWRGRFYVVRAVLAHWVETGAWWQRPDGSTRPPSPASARCGGWRPAAGRDHGVGVYDLCFDWSAGGWTLLRAQD